LAEGFNRSCFLAIHCNGTDGLSLSLMVASLVGAGNKCYANQVSADAERCQRYFNHFLAKVRKVEFDIIFISFPAVMIFILGTIQFFTFVP
jgi:hypothetical protein